MRSRAAVGNHPLHPALVAIPIGAFTVTVIGDVMVLAGSNAWVDTARFSLGVGIVTALLAALFGFVDYFRMPMSARGKQLATRHMILNLVAVVLMVVSFWLRLGDPSHWSTAAFGASTLAFLMLLLSGWIGGDMVYQHKLAVVENADPEATAIGQRESA
jgi:uncharacterized membrane protein